MSAARLWSHFQPLGPYAASASGPPSDTGAAPSSAFSPTHNRVSERSTLPAVARLKFQSTVGSPSERDTQGMGMGTGFQSLSKPPPPPFSEPSQAKTVPDTRGLTADNV